MMILPVLLGFRLRNFCIHFHSSVYLYSTSYGYIFVRFNILKILIQVLILNFVFPVQMRTVKMDVVQLGLVQLGMDQKGVVLFSVEQTNIDP